ncbi:TonB-dependent receptor [Edaphobacter paludis]|uniref:TonB-dependent receptor n=1 Tax=Edaphobacter paludis TaxID=3035702 RepID=A0AAU7D826_9BACT
MPLPSLNQILAIFAFGIGLLLSGSAQAKAKDAQLSGVVRDQFGQPVIGAEIAVAGKMALTDSSGSYSLTVVPGLVKLEVSLDKQTSFRIALDVEQDRTFDIALRKGDSVTVRASEDALTPDPSTQGFSRSDLIDANPGRPGVPLSIPGYPTETASGGIKAPQYFAPGVAGDHGEPIAQFFQVGGFLFQNNLTANAHGNGYADPNFVIASTVGGVLVDNAAYNARYGDHSINLAATYDLKDRLSPFVQGATDGRDGAISAGWSPANISKRGWIAAEALWGNGFLKRAEERQQYKINASRTWDIGRHELTAYGLGYYGFSRIPGLIPINTFVPNDSIDLRQLDLTHTSLVLLADHWQISEKSALTTGIYFRTYSLKLQSNFGDGLIRQSEFRTVQGGDVTYSNPLSRNWLLLAGLDTRRDAPRGLDLAKADNAGQFQIATSNDLTITNISPFAAVSGRILPQFQAYLGLRRDQIRFDNRDNIQSASSFNSWPGTTSPKINLTFGRPNASVFPQIALSWAKAFHANDPRIGDGSGRGDLIIQAREYQLFATKQVFGNEVRLTLAHITNSAELAKIDADTGLQENVGPSINRFLTLAIRRRLSRGFLQISWSAADARDRQLGEPIPEAPRTIIDAVGGLNQLPLGLAVKGEYEYVKAKPLGDGFTGVPLQEIRLALTKSFVDGRWQVSVNGQLNNGYTGQTLETLAVGNETAAFERPVGVPSRSYAVVSANYSFGR